MNSNVYYCANASCSTSKVQPTQEGSAGHSGNQEIVGHWDEERQMMFFSVMEAPTSDFNVVEESSPLAMEYFEESQWTQESMHYAEAFYPVEPCMIPAVPIEIGGTTFYTQGSTSSGYSSSEEPSSPPMEVVDRCEWMDEIEQPLAIIDDLASIHQVLEGLLLEEHQMKEAGYPVIDDEGRVQIQPTTWERGTSMWIDENEKLRRCSRCRVTYAIGVDGGFPTGQGICQSKSKGQWSLKDSHITMQRFASEMDTFVATPASSGEEDHRSNQVFALDVEMVATTAGPALARLSVVDFNGQLQLDVFVKPESEVVDCLTEFSGITMENLESATHSLEDCRDLFFSLVNAESILIGHGLDGDLKALRVIHHRVIDTSILYQNNGKKVALRVLAKQYLDRTIQADNSSTFGHCSEEDALASLDLVKHRINFS